MKAYSVVSAMVGILLCGAWIIAVSGASAERLRPNRPNPSPGGPQARLAGEPPCAWKSKTTPELNNVFAPDTNAVYWTTDFTYRPGMQIVLSGRYPAARYMSFNVYDGQGSSLTNVRASSITDYKIAAQPGHENPFVTGGASGGAYELTLRADPENGSGNVLALVSPGTAAGTRGSFIMRIYLGRENVLLPQVSVRFGDTGATTPLNTCPQDFRPKPLPDVRRVKRTCRPAECLVFYRSAAGGATLYPNADSAYVHAFVQPPQGDNVIVVRGKAPSSPEGTDPPAWNERGNGYDVRYWSMCSNLVDDPQPVVINKISKAVTYEGCATNVDQGVVAGGYYTFVVGREDQRRAVESLRLPGVTFLPLSLRFPEHMHALVLRNMLPGIGFSQSTTRVDADSGLPSDAAEQMGAYYPTAKLCLFRELERAGPTGCLQ